MIYYVVLKSNGEILKYSTQREDLNSPYIWRIDMDINYPSSQNYISYGLIKAKLKAHFRDEQLKNIL